MRIANRLFVRLRSLAWRFEDRVYRSGAVRQARRNGGRLTMPRSCRVAVRLRCNGAGEVILGERVALGFKKAPMLGRGTILLQARSRSARIVVGAGTTTSNNICVIAHANIEIGSDCRIGDQVVIYDCDFHEVNPETRNASEGATRPVRLGDNVWLGSRVMILKGVQIGDHSVVAAGSVVTASIPARSLAAGNPARVLRSI